MFQPWVESLNFLLKILLLLFVLYSSSTVPLVLRWCSVGFLECSAGVSGNVQLFRWSAGVWCSLVSCSGVLGFIVCQFGCDCWQIIIFFFFIFFFFFFLFFLFFFFFFFFFFLVWLVPNQLSPPKLQLQVKKNDVIFAAMCFYLLQAKNVSKIHSGCSTRLKLHFT